ncbi:DnaJ sub C member 7 [Phlyctochytrium planicorne]|nr:DnaJ sub C member 7 [Phlyctochytrium planicorne]
MGLWDPVDESGDDATPFVNEYKGFHPKSLAWKPERVPSSISPQEFFKRFVNTRTPCILTGEFLDEDWRASQLWTPEYLKRKAGDAVVQVETRRNEKDTFGSSRPRIHAVFRDVLDDCLEGNTDIYLSTQYEEEETLHPGHATSAPSRISIGTEMETVDRFEQFCHQPLRRLFGDFPLKPDVAGNLVPQQVNLWLGASGPKGSSSGLHHDNIYVLLKGKKRFTILSPLEAENLYLHGKMKKVHRNGLIQYSSKQIRQDGAYVADVLRWKLKAAKLLLEESIGTSDEKRRRKEVESLTFELMETEADADDIDDEDLELIEDDYVDEDDDFGDGKDKMDDLENVEEDKEDSDDDDEIMQDDDGEEDEDKGDGDNGDDDEDDEDFEPKEPPSFSKIDPSTLHSKSASSTFPLLKNATKVSFELNAGEMLYLPASWFHEVHSYPSTEPESPSIHLALNYWFHPPSTPDYELPYEDMFWESRWMEMTSLLEGKMGPMASLMAKRNPGAWMVRRKSDGKYLGQATRATNPFRIRDL